MIACSTTLKGVSTVVATRSIALQARSGLHTRTFDTSQSPSPRKWTMAAGSNGYRAALVMHQLTPGLISSLPGTAGLSPFISFSTSYPDQFFCLTGHTTRQVAVVRRGAPAGRRLSSLASFPPGRANSDVTVDAGLRPEAVEAGPHVGCFGPFDLRAQTVVPSAQRADIHEEASVKTKEQDEYGTS